MIYRRKDHYQYSKSKFNIWDHSFTEADSQRGFVKKVFLEI